MEKRCERGSKVGGGLIQERGDSVRAGGSAVGQHPQCGGDAVGGEEDILAGIFFFQRPIQIEGEAIDAFFEVGCRRSIRGRDDFG